MLWGILNATISITFAIGSALAAVAAVLLCSAYPQIDAYTGSMPGIKAFVAAYVLETGRIVLKGDAKTLMDNDQVKKAYLGE